MPENLVNPIRNEELSNGVSIIIPAYNEKEGISQVIDSLQALRKSHSYRWEIIVVDDGSTDGTADMIKNRKDVVLVQHSLNRGYGAAIKTGIRHAKYDNLIISDADGTYSANDIPRLLSALGGLSTSEMVVGSRERYKSNIPLVRRPAKWMINKLANYLTGTKIPDLNSGLRAMKKDVVMKFSHLLPDGFSFTTTITLAMLTNDYTVEFIPIEYKIRSGKSKIRPIRDTLNFIQLIIRTVLYFDPLKIFLPISMFFFIASIAVLILSYLFTPKVMDITTVILFISGVQILAIGMIADLIDKRSRQ
jgi:glycosyltransferase involved in cell wall biosynthesis